jgi:hypothetical protein
LILGGIERWKFFPEKSTDRERKSGIDPSLAAMKILGETVFWRIFAACQKPPR